MSIKATIKKSFWGEYSISIYHSMMCKILPKLVSDEKAVKKLYKKKSGKKLDLLNPRTFAEKINWYKLNDKNPLMEQCADKVAVRDYIIEKGYGDCLNKVYGVYDRVEDIDIDRLPNQFVIKAAHGSHMNYIVKDKSSFDWKHAKKMMKSWLKQDIYWSGREWVYKKIPKRLIIERYLEDSEGDLKDYKFFCFNGKPYYLEYDAGRFGPTHYRNYYNMKMELMPFCDGDQLPNNEKISFPLNENTFKKMKTMCVDLASSFQQVRVDFYSVKDKILLGELTFFDGGGTTIFTPEEWNYKFSEEWKIIKQS